MKSARSFAVRSSAGADGGDVGEVGTGPLRRGDPLPEQPVLPRDAQGAQDGAAIAKLYTADGVEMPPNAPAQKGRAAIEAYHKQFASQMMVHNLEIKATDTRVLGDVALDVGTYSQNLMPVTGGGKTIVDKGKYLVVLKYDAGGAWLISHAIYNSDLPLPAPAPAK